MKKKISELTVDELNLVVAVMRGWKEIDGKWYAPNDTNCPCLFMGYRPDIASRPELWWPIARDNKIHILWLDTKVQVGSPYRTVMPDEVGEAVLRCWIMSEFGEEVDLV